jgi:hypothetical protein
VSDAPPVNFMPTEVATAQMEPFSMELNAQSEQPTDVSEFQTPTGTELTVSASQVSQPTEIHASVMDSLWEIIVKDVPPSQTLSGPAEYADATTDMPMLTVFVPSSLPSQLNATSELFSIHNSKSAFHALMDVSPARLATTVLNADPIMFLMPRADFVLKFVVMPRDTLHNVMMEITSMVMGAAGIAESKSDSHATVVHQAPEMLAAPFCHQPFRLKTEVNQDFSERLF